MSASKIPTETPEKPNGNGDEVAGGYKGLWGRARGRTALVMIAVATPLLTSVFFMASAAGVIPSEAARAREEMVVLRSRMEEHVKQTDKLIDRLTTSVYVLCMSINKTDRDRLICEALQK